MTLICTCTRLYAHVRTRTHTYAHVRTCCRTRTRTRIRTVTHILTKRHARSSIEYQTHKDAQARIHMHVRTSSNILVGGRSALVGGAVCDLRGQDAQWNTSVKFVSMPHAPLPPNQLQSTTTSSSNHIRACTVCVGVGGKPGTSLEWSRHHNI